MKSAQPDAVMHFAANALVGESMTNPSKYFRNNVGGGINLLDAIVAAGCKRMVFSSTCLPKFIQIVSKVFSWSLISIDPCLYSAMFILRQTSTIPESL